MRQQTKRKRRAKFSGRKQSIRGLVGLGLSITAMISLLVMINIAFVKEGNAQLLLGSFGVLTIVGFTGGTVLDIMALKEEEVYKVVPVVGTVLGILGMLAGSSIYIMGMTS